MSEELAKYEVNTVKDLDEEGLEGVNQIVKEAVKKSDKAEVVSVLIEVHSGNLELLETWGVENEWWTDTQGDYILGWLRGVSKKDLFDLYNNI